MCRCHFHYLKVQDKSVSFSAPTLYIVLYVRTPYDEAAAGPDPTSNPEPCPSVMQTSFEWVVNQCSAVTEIR